jgi:multidrug efflux pump subunit AcrA (membrane-fusion protein)
MKINKKIKIAVGIGFLIIGIIFGVNKILAQKNSEPTYKTEAATKGTLIVSLSASGSVTANNSRTVTTTASGVVKKILVKEGQKVYTGQPIMTIDLDLSGKQKYLSASSSYQSAVNSLKASRDRYYTLQNDLVAAKNVFDNQWSMQSPDDVTYIQKHNSYLSAQEAFNNLEKTIKQQEVGLESVRISYMLSSPTVYAPITGAVSAISLAPGMILNPTSDSANSTNSENKIAIVKTGAMPAITVTLTEIDVSKVKVGNKVTVTLDAYSNKTFTGKVIAVDTTGTVSSGVVSYPTTILLDSEVEGILPNMSATANIITNIKDGVIMVPNSAIQTDGTVKVKVGDQIKSVEVETGIASDTYTEILTGINEGDEVVTATNQNSSTKSSSTSTTSVFGGSGIRMGGMGR